MERSHNRFDICHGPHRGCCNWSFNHGGLRRSGDAAVLPRGLSKPTLVSGRVYMYVYLIYRILILKSIRIIFSTCIYIIKRNAGGLWRRPSSMLSEKVLRSGRYVLKESYYPQTTLMKLVLYNCFIYCLS